MSCNEEPDKKDEDPITAPFKRHLDDLVVFVPKFRAVAMPFAAPLDNLLMEKVFEKEKLIGYFDKGPKPLTVSMP